MTLPDTKLPKKRWFRRDCFITPFSVQILAIPCHFGSYEMTSTALRKITHLGLSGASIDDEAVRALASIKSLEYLDLLDTSITDSSLKELHPLKNLASLGLVKCKL